MEPFADCDLSNNKLARTPSKTDVKLNCRVFLAEDSRDNQLLTSFLLEKAGADVTVAKNGQLAFDWALAAEAENRPFDVILMDMHMPLVDGYEATRRLRGAGYDKPIVAFTSFDLAG